MPRKKNKKRNVTKTREDDGHDQETRPPENEGVVESSGGEQPPNIGGGVGAAEKPSGRKTPEPQQTSENPQEDTPPSAATIPESTDTPKAAPEISRPEFKLVQRPDHGRNGRLIKLFANYFLLDFNPDLNFYHYDVDIRQSETSKGVMDTRTAKEDILAHFTHIEHQLKRTPGKQRCRTILSAMLSSEKLRQYHAVYDGQKNIYTLKKFPFRGKKTFMVPLKEGDRCYDFEVTLSEVDKGGGRNFIQASDLSAIYEGKTAELSQEVVMVFETIMNHREPPFLHQIPLGRSFISLRPEGDLTERGMNFQLKSGYNQSVHFTERGPAVVVNHAVMAFHPPGSVIEYVKKLLGRDVTKAVQLRGYDIKTISKRLTKVKVQATHQKSKRKYTITGISEESAKVLRIEGSKTTVAEYFKNNYSQLRYPYLPCLEMQSTKKCYLPMEVCSVLPNQPILKSQEGQENSQIIRKTAIPPVNRFGWIDEHVREIGEFSGDAMAQFDLRMETQFMGLNGRVLPAPTIKYKGEKSFAKPDEKGTWKMHRNCFQRSAANRPCSWAIVDFAWCGIESLEIFVNKLRTIGNAHGMILEHPRFIEYYEDDVSTVNALRKAKEAKVDFALVVLNPNKDDKERCYEKVKFLAETELQLLTQCVQKNTMGTFVRAEGRDAWKKEQKMDQTAFNILLKLNTKLGGVNHELVQKPDLLKQPAIIFGADVVHWPRDRNYPSIAAVVGSSDNYPFQYVVNCKTQTYEKKDTLSQETITDLKDMVKKILGVFKTKIGKKPMKIVFFRDGVSEGEFSKVGNYEVPMIQEACFEELDGFVPPLTFIVVQKNHQTRFRPQNPEEGIGRMKNVPVGTTVDTDVVHPVHFDFFLCSHEGIQGTSKPAHYTVIYDNNKFTSDELQKLCYQLCYMYASCNRSISIPVPVMYADLACTRAKAYADLHVKIDDNGGNTKKDKQKIQRKFPKEVEDAINNIGKGESFKGMYFI